jgi:hypothetical protein
MAENLLIKDAPIKQNVPAAAKHLLLEAAVLLVFGFVFAQLQAAGGHAPSLKPRQETKIPRC